MYKCSFCGKEFDSAVDRARCEIKCDDMVRKEAERLKIAKYNEEKDRAEKQINDAVQSLDKNITEYIKKYGTLPSSFKNNRYYSVPLCF